MRARSEPPRDLLEQALRAADCALDLDAALANPTLRILLMNHADALARAQAASLNRVRRLAGSNDWRARAAGDS